MDCGVGGVEGKCGGKYYNMPVCMEKLFQTSKKKQYVCLCMCIMV